MYIESYHAYEMKFGNILMPKKFYKEAELQAGKSPVVEITDEEFEKLKTLPDFASLLKTRQYRALDSMPKKYLSGNNKIQALEADKKLRDSEIEQLKAKIKILEENEPKKSIEPEGLIED